MAFQTRYGEEGGERKPYAKALEWKTLMLASLCDQSRSSKSDHWKTETL